MLASIITPTHLQNSNLEELYDSIIAQTYTDWEWVILLNGDAKHADIPQRIKEDEKVKIFLCVGENTNVGFVKNKAFGLGSGEILVEVDHDDIITPNCLQRLVETFQDPTVGFVYSNCAVLKEDGDFIPYNASIGWTYETFNWKGKELITMHSFPPTSQSFTYIWYCPDHVRAWRTTTYNEIGGYNPELSVCDDHEIVARTYIHTKCVHIPETLYIYRISGKNTWLQRNALVQEKTHKVFKDFIVRMAEKDADDKNLRKVSVGIKKDGYLYLDKENADINWDLNVGFPLTDNSVGVLVLHHAIQKLKDQVGVMTEIHRVLADGGWVFIEVPSTDGRGAWQDPTHVSFWNDNSFKYYTEEYYAGLINNKTVRFQNFKTETVRFGDNVAVTSSYLTAYKSDRKRPIVSHS